MTRGRIRRTNRKTNILKINCNAFRGDVARWLRSPRAREAMHDDDRIITYATAWAILMNHKNTVKLRIVAGSRIQAGPRIQAGGSIELYQ